MSWLSPLSNLVILYIKKIVTTAAAVKKEGIYATPHLKLEVLTPNDYATEFDSIQFLGKVDSSMELSQHPGVNSGNDSGT